MIYLDYNATTPIDPVVAEAMIPFIKEHFGNPSSSHVFGQVTKNAVNTAREQVVQLLNCQADTLIFTGGGSESNNQAIKGIAWMHQKRGKHIITSSIEHPAVINVCKWLENQGFTITYLPVDGFGTVDPDQVKNAITTETILITIMHANNEVGTIQPIREIAEIAHQHGVLMHTDAAQSVGKIPVDVAELGVDLLTVAGHKLYAPKGIGALYIKSGVEIERLIHGASHELGLRAGTENVIEIVGLGKACQILYQHNDHGQLKELRDRLQSGLQSTFPDSRINGHPQKRLPNTLSISFKGKQANRILANLPTVAASAGAACHSDTIHISSTLQAMNVPLDYAMGTIRLSVGRFTTQDEIDQALPEICRAVEKA